EIFTQQLKNCTSWFVELLKDPYVGTNPAWFKVFVYLEVFLHLPFFLAAMYAFAKGGRHWIKIPSIIWSVQVITMTLQMVYVILNDDFSNYKTKVVPETLEERYQLAGCYLCFVIIPICLLVYMLTSQKYNNLESSAFVKKVKKN
ncbi:hypothetical protein HELRODRAFT_89250, partial [Helobdella robusta]|uniref:Sigma intracellular receptor 2 n=1 Tax=Helobdella robusta TaxID=6412 RepID=T1G7B0_HELRO